MRKTDTQAKLIALQNSWVRLNPDPQGVIVLIGGYFFGTVPTTYNSFIDGLCSQNYTVIFYPYSFAEPSHWKIAKQLLEQIECCQEEIIKKAQRQGYKTDIYSDFSNYCFVGHSLGCECIALIQFLGLDKHKQHEFLQEACRDLGQNEVTKYDICDVDKIPSEKPIPYKASLLMAPCFRSPKAIQVFYIRPKEKLMQYLIEKSPLLPLTGLISFKGDDIADRDVMWLHENLGNHRLVHYHEIQGEAPFSPHLIPNFDPIKSGLLDYAAQSVQELIQRQKWGKDQGGK